MMMCLGPVHQGTITIITLHHPPLDSSRAAQQEASRLGCRTRGLPGRAGWDRALDPKLDVLKGHGWQLSGLYLLTLRRCREDFPSGNKQRVYIPMDRGRRRVHNIVWFDVLLRGEYRETSSADKTKSRSLQRLSSSKGTELLRVWKLGLNKWFYWE